MVAASFISMSTIAAAKHEHSRNAAKHDHRRGGEFEETDEPTDFIVIEVRGNDPVNIIQGEDVIPAVEESHVIGRRVVYHRKPYEAGGAGGEDRFVERKRGGDRYRMNLKEDSEYDALNLRLKEDAK